MGTVKAAVKSASSHGSHAQQVPRTANETGYVRKGEQDRMKGRGLDGPGDKQGAMGAGKFEELDEQSYGAAALDLHRALKKARGKKLLICIKGYPDPDNIATSL